MLSGRVRSVWLIASSIWATGCAEGASQHADLLMWDSAGISVVDNLSPVSELPQWGVASSATVRIGSRDGDSEALYRVQGALRTPSGHYVVANGGTNEIRIFTRAGELESTFGRTGGGQGEFQWLRALWHRGDTLVAFDNSLMRVSMFTLQEGFIRSFRLQSVPGSGRPSARGSFSNGEILALNAPTGGVGPGSGGVLPPAEWTLSRYAADGEYVSLIASVKESPRWGHSIPGLPPGIYLPFTLDKIPYAVHGNSVYVGRSPERAEIEVFSVDASLKSQIRWAEAPVDVTAAHRDQYRAHMRDEGANAGFNNQAWHRFLQEVHFPEVMPVYRRLLVSEQGNVWVERYSEPWAEAERDWIVFSSGGRLLARVSLGKDFQLLDVSSDLLVGIRQDDLGVEYIEVLRLLASD